MGPKNIGDMKMDLSRDLRGLLKSEGAALIGFADLEEIPSENKKGLPVGICIGVSLSRKIVSGINKGPTAAYVEECLRLDDVLNRIGQKTVKMLTHRGHMAKMQATTITPGMQTPSNFETLLPHKTIATRAGLGWIGKCALLITKPFGSAVRLGSILTNAELPTGTPINTSSCGECNECMDICPAHALSGNNWEVGLPRKSLVDVIECRKTARDRLSKRIGREVIGRTFCGMCIASCPWTQNYVRS